MMEDAMIKYDLMQDKDEDFADLIFPDRENNNARALRNAEKRMMEMNATTEPGIILNDNDDPMKDFDGNNNDYQQDLFL